MTWADQFRWAAPVQNRVLKRARKYNRWTNIVLAVAAMILIAVIVIS